MNYMSKIVRKKDVNKNIKKITKLNNIFNESIKIKHNEFYFYYFSAKENDKMIMKSGLWTPYYMYKIGEYNLCFKVTEKYRYRLCNGWGIYPNRVPDSLTLEEILNGLEKFRGLGGKRMISLLRYPLKYKYCKKNTYYREVLDGVNFYKVDIDNLDNIIERIDWGHYQTHTDNPPLNREYYESITEEEYFKEFVEEEAKNSKPINLAHLSHIQIVVKDGILPSKYIKKLNRGE